MTTRRKLILSLCDHSGNWSRPYAEDPGYEVVRMDLADGHDVRLLQFSRVPVHGILAAPPCTQLSAAGRPSWGRKGEEAVIEAMGVVDACLRAVFVYKPAWWALENPVGRLNDYLGKWSWTFQPCDFGGYLAPGEKTLDCPLMPVQDRYSKLTCIWGTAKKPEPRRVPVAHERHSKGGWRNPCFLRHEDHRSITPLGFARAFKEANP